jgi:hypothetical protein
MPKMRAKTFGVRRQKSGSVFLKFTAMNGRDYEFEIAEAAFPNLGRNIAGAFRIGPPVPLGFPQLADAKGQSIPLDQPPTIPPRTFSAETAPGSNCITLSFRYENGIEMNVTFLIDQVEGIFEAIGKALTLAKSAEPTTKQ